MQHQSFALECTPDSFKPRTAPTNRITTLQAMPYEAARCQYLWSEVGAGYWTERCHWNLTRWQEHLARPDVSFWIALTSQQDAGCFELTELARSTKIEGFGLLPSYRDRGLGRELLTAATQLSFQSGAPKVSLHTATDDHPNALPNYLSGGYRIIRVRELKNPVRP
jgi:ribosomal protein S18 acetylase RimI-like enzyme